VPADRTSVVEGGTENPHVHFFLIFHASLKSASASLRSLLRTNGLRGNRSYSLKRNDEEYPIEYIAYLMKEGKPKFHNIPQDILTEAKLYNEKVKSEIKEKKLNRRTQLQKIDEYLHEEHAYLFDEEDKFPADLGRARNQLLDAVLSYYVDSGTLMREFQVISIVQTLLLKYDSSYFQQFKSKLFDKIF